MTSSKILGDAGEHYAISQFSFNGLNAMKMPDNWKSYDIGVEKNNKLLKVSVKTRSETIGWLKSKWFSWDKEDNFDFIVLIFRDKKGEIFNWVLPNKIANMFCSVPSVGAKDQNYRELSWSKLQQKDLLKYRNNWNLIQK